jgi:hypothetical protein
MARSLRKLAYAILAFIALVIGFFTFINYVEANSTDTKIWNELVDLSIRSSERTRKTGLSGYAKGARDPGLLSRYDLICFVTGEPTTRPTAWLTKPACDLKDGKAATKRGLPNVASIGLIRAGRAECVWTYSAYRVDADVCIPPSRLEVKPEFYFPGPVEPVSTPELLYVEITQRD